MSSCIARGHDETARMPQFSVREHIQNKVKEDRRLEQLNISR